MEAYLKETLCFGLDIGTRTVIGVVGYKDGNEFVLVDYACKEHEERAMLDGQIHDIQKVARAVYEVKSTLEKRLAMPLKEVAIAAAGRSLSTQIVEITHEFEEVQEVSLSDIHHLELEGVEQAKALQQATNHETDYYCVAYSVINYHIDEYMMTNLEGHRGKKVRAKLIATFLPKQVIDSLYAVTERAELTVSHLTLEPIAAMNAVIPEQIRLLNLALVDIGAGTSDIAITKEGSVVAYGMIPTAGDEVTEAIVHKYLVDFNTAEIMKKQAISEEKITYQDIIGLSHEMASSDLKQVIEPVIERMTKEISERIQLLNGDTSPNAVFCVGGGSQMVDVTQYIAKGLQLVPERVAVRSTSHLVNVRDEAGLLDSPQMITPLGICMTMVQSKYNQFTFVTVNGNKVQLLNAKKLTILDAIIAVGIEHDSIFPKKGATLMYRLNGERQRLKGDNGTPAAILLNGKEASIQDHIQDGDQIEVSLAIPGKTPQVYLKDLVGITYTVTLEDRKILLPMALVNGEMASHDYCVMAGDEVVITTPKTLGELLDILGMSSEGLFITKSFKPVTLEETLHDGDVFLMDHVKLEEDVVVTKEEEVPKVPAAEQSEQEAALAALLGIKMEAESEVGSQQEMMQQVVATNLPDSKNLYVIVNNQTICLPDKGSDYILAGIFDFIDFDLSKPQGTIKLTRNGLEGALTDVLHDGDILEIYWKK